MLIKKNGRILFLSLTVLSSVRSRLVLQMTQRKCYSKLGLYQFISPIHPITMDLKNGAIIKPDIPKAAIKSNV